VSKPVSLAIAALLLAFALAAAAGTDVQVVAPITIAVGETIDGVTLVSADRRGAVLRIRGVTKTLPLSSYRGSVGDATAESVTLSADANGQFMARGAVNGAAVQVLVDTGATFTALSREQAKRIGIDFSRGKPVRSMTVNGAVSGWRVLLDSVQVGNATERNVEAIVVDNDSLPIGLLGMSYLNRFDMQRRGSTLVLRRR
jgi:aspartyl protease family protein